MVLVGQRSRFRPGRFQFMLSCAFLGSLLAASGCMAPIMSLTWLLKGPQVTPAKTHALKSKRVAVVCISEAVGYVPGSPAEHLARKAELQLKQNVRKIEMISQDKVIDWIDQHDWDSVDFEEVGKGVDAELLVAVEMGSYRLHDGQTLFRGRADLRVRVLDIANDGEVILDEKLFDIMFPENGGQSTAGTTEGRFRNAFTDVLASRVARLFYDYEFDLQIANEARLLSQL